MVQRCQLENGQEPQVCEGKGKIRDWCDVGKAIARRVGMKGMVSVTPIYAYKGCFFVDPARRAQWIQDQGSFNSERRDYCSEEMVAKRELSR